MAFAVYEQSTGRFVILDIDDGGTERCLDEFVGYAGKPPFVNDPTAERRKSQGPLPRGFWRVGSPVAHPRLVPLAFPLEPMAKTRTFGRSGFFVHGDSKTRPGKASSGCIILPRHARDAVLHYQVKHIEVVA